MQIQTTDISITTGLTLEDIQLIVNKISVYKEIDKALIFGSRAKGNYKHGSDVDICLMGNHITLHQSASLSWKLNEETNLPWHFDILVYNNLTNQELKEHIDRVGIQIYP
jgi:predicted nucleotidyltransferase